MPKPDPALLDPARYPFRCTIETRFRDLDINMHVNNVSLAGILEEARVRFHRSSGYHDVMHGVSAMAASLSIQFLGESYYPDPLDVHVAATNVGRTSHTLGQLVFQHDRPVAYAQVVLVCVRDSRPTELPEQFRESIQPWTLKPGC